MCNMQTLKGMALETIEITIHDKERKNTHGGHHRRRPQLKRGRTSSDRKEQSSEGAPRH
jgi:hypothetical protein